MQKLGATTKYLSVPLDNETKSLMSSRSHSKNKSSHSSTRVSVAEKGTFSTQQKQLKKVVRKTSSHKRNSSKMSVADDQSTQYTKDEAEEELLLDEDDNMEDEFAKAQHEAQVERLREQIQQKMKEKMLTDLKQHQAANERRVQLSIEEIRAARAKINPIIGRHDISEIIATDE